MVKIQKTWKKAVWMFLCMAAFCSLLVSEAAAEAQAGTTREATIRVVSIIGNELTYYEMEETEETSQRQRPDGEMSQREMSQREMSQETVTVYLPVGVKVHTDTGGEMTFGILQDQDQLEVLFQVNEEGAEIIVEIWMT